MPRLRSWGLVRENHQVGVGWLCGRLLCVCVCVCRRGCLRGEHGVPARACGWLVGGQAEPCWESTPTPPTNSTHAHTAHMLTHPPTQHTCPDPSPPCRQCPLTDTHIHTAFSSRSQGKLEALPMTESIQVLQAAWGIAYKEIGKQGGDKVPTIDMITGGWWLCLVHTCGSWLAAGQHALNAAVPSSLQATKSPASPHPHPPTPTNARTGAYSVFSEGDRKSVV